MFPTTHVLRIAFALLLLVHCGGHVETSEPPAPPPATSDGPGSPHPPPFPEPAEAGKIPDPRPSGIVHPDGAPAPEDAADADAGSVETGADVPFHLPPKHVAYGDSYSTPAPETILDNVAPPGYVTVNFDPQFARTLVTASTGICMFTFLSGTVFGAVTSATLYIDSSDNKWFVYSEPVQILQQTYGYRGTVACAPWSAFSKPPTGWVGNDVHGSPSYPFSATSTYSTISAWGPSNGDSFCYPLSIGGDFDKSTDLLGMVAPTQRQPNPWLLGGEESNSNNNVGAEAGCFSFSTASQPVYPRIRTFPPGSFLPSAATAFCGISSLSGYLSNGASNNSIGISDPASSSPYFGILMHVCDKTEGCDAVSGQAMCIDYALP